MLSTTLIQPGDPKGGVSVDQFTTRAAVERLERSAELLRSKGIRVEILALLGGIADTILEQARLRRADAIVMGTHGRRGLAHLLLGSVAERVIRSAEVPVVTVRCSAEDDVDPLPEAVPLTS